ncbi:GntR family transcriptional regulator [Xanthobacter autotrophicus]|uniref:GntR family transcriptional regulator n=1 Tax=Xanthobacter autotrophicus TaxID=280 RepID=UPI0024A6DC1E|nr:GntR family transcriptional regulator [Xanthobacter autotrophicus]MDI4657928.1 GntR family transcriptional regulator [Xanthobacter autotrophicus]
MEHKTASADEDVEAGTEGPPPGLDTRVVRIVRQTLADQVYGDLKELLLAGRAAPGERFTLRGLASAIGTSAMPVREAVSRLVAENALEVLPNRAVRVPLMPRARFKELRLIRCSLEGLATETAVRAASDAEIAEVEGFERLFAAERDKPEPDGAAAMCHNKDLHFALYRAAHLPTLFQMIEGLWLQIGPVLNLDFRAGPDRVRQGEAHIRHAAMVAALKARDPEAARTALVADIWSAGDFILSRNVLPD